MRVQLPSLSCVFLVVVSFFSVLLIILVFFSSKNILNFSIVNIDSFYFSGGHVGHLFVDWYPEAGIGLKNLSYRRANFVFFNLNKTNFFLNKACIFLKQMAKRGVVPLYVGNTKASSGVVKLSGTFANINFVVDSWIGGLLTNFKNVVLLPLKKNFCFSKKKNLVGLKKLDFVPEVVLCSSEFYAPFAVSESNTLLVPTISVADSNLRVVESTYPVALNDDSILVFKNFFFFLSSSFWFGRADFAMSYLFVTHTYMLSKIISNNDPKLINLYIFKKFQKWLTLTVENPNLIISPIIKNFFAVLY